MVMVRVFIGLLGIIFISNHLNCSGKERFRRFLSIPGEFLLIEVQSRKSVLHRLVLIMDHTFGHALIGIRNLREITAKAALFFLAKNELFQIYSSVLKVLLSV